SRKRQREPEDSATKGRKVYVKQACTTCKASHVACDADRPCQRFSLYLFFHIFCLFHLPRFQVASCFPQTLYCFVRRIISFDVDDLVMTSRPLSISFHIIFSW
ncbi:MAG: hypothetical protein BJ554DRAFT_4363, partial [Olpidium bornovanus]